MRRPLGPATITCALVLSLVAATPGRAQAALSSTVAPAEVTLTPRGSASGVLLVSNGGDEETTFSVQVYPADKSVSVAMSKTTDRIAKKTSIALAFTVTRTSEGSGQATTVSFVVSPATDKQTVATLTVKAAATADLVQAAIQADLQNINENRPGTAALVITNPRETPITVRRLEVSAPLAVKVTLSCRGPRTLVTPAGETESFAGCPATVAPRSQELVPIELDVEDAVAPGPRSLLVQVTAGREGETQSVVASTTFTVDVFAESDLLKSIGVPIFLLLPGVIIVVTAWFLIRTLPPWRRVARGLSLGDAASKATAVAVLGLAISLVMALLYPRFTDWFFPGTARNYVKAYGFRDFYFVIGYSFAVALLVWALVAASFVIVRWLFLPWPRDEPLALLRKIGIRGRLGGGTAYPRVTVVADGQSKKGLELWAPGETRLVVPVLVVSPDQQQAPDLAVEIQRRLDDGEAYELWQLVRNAVRGKRATIAVKNGNVAAPLLVANGADGTKLEREESPGSIVEL